MFDVLIKNGMICDGTGDALYKANIGIMEDRIAYIGSEEGEAAAVIDADGKVVTPGFIDPHTHADLSILTEPAMEPFVKQGVTTVVTGNCGYCMAPQGKNTFYCFSMNQNFQESGGADPADPLPLLYDRKKAEQAFYQMYGIEADWNSFDQYNRKCDLVPLGCNVAPLQGYSAVRTAVMGRDCMRPASEDEIRQMEALVKEAMEAGAFGLSSGRDPAYIPGPFAEDGEMRRMIKIAADYDGIFASHTANYDKDGNVDRMEGYREFLRQAKDIDVRLHISHAHVMFMADSAEDAAAAAEKSLAYFDTVRKEGADLSWDVIPSPFCCNFTQVSMGYYLKPLVNLAGGQKELARLWQTELFRQKVHRMLETGSLPSLDAKTEGNLLLDLCVLKHKNSSYVGKYIGECAELLEKEPLDAALDMFVEDEGMVADFVPPVLGNSVDILCKSPYAMPCSDGFGFSKETNLSGNDEAPIYPNSMNIGMIPRYLTRYGKDDFAGAVRQCTGFAAERFGIAGRGVLREGNFADLVVLDRKNLHSFDEDINPLKDPTGIEYVLVNGQITLTPKGLTKAGSGRVLRKR